MNWHIWSTKKIILRSTNNIIIIIKSLKGILNIIIIATKITTNKIVT